MVAIAKIGGIVDLSNEAVTDSSINLTASLGTVIQDSLSRDLDLGLLNGSGPPEPVGVIGVAPTAVGADLLAQVTVAKGAIGDSGGTPTALAICATALAAEDAKQGTSRADVTRTGSPPPMGLTAGRGACPGDPAGLRPVAVLPRRAERRDGGAEPGLALRPGCHHHQDQGPGGGSDPRPGEGDPQAVSATTQTSRSGKAA